ncbi:transcriptional regulator [Amycolatopsis sp. FDAARGOS 1241]|uniref:transcriptional regulator n=1 Tax=Amycolatopsis sp. FDAARGOS 1241 TaxID=2778070 RepID=UPI00194EDE71|nr:transcriptional regulator [Amycolatopsis sp. FDAARGOS 1241]QRP47537.1 transcriptional regulator [Amycolatopsis sp. FDAARGOS 1241]
MTARDLLDAIQGELAPRDDDNRLVPLIAAGRAPRAVFAAIAAEERWIVRSDWRSFHALAARADEPGAREFFGGLAPGELLALDKLDALAAAAGEDPGTELPRAGCQAYPAYFAWLALNGEAAEVAVAIFANFAAWGRYCAAVAAAMREHYGFAGDACAFFDFFAADVPEIEERALATIQAGLDAGRFDADRARTYARLFQSYELLFWNTLADEFSA